MLKLEIGKRYVTRGGEIGTLNKNNEEGQLPNYPFRVTKKTVDYSVTAEGKYWHDSCHQEPHHKEDLVKEYTEDKVFKIEVGKYYISRDGEYKIGPVQEKGNDKEFPFFAKYKSLKTQDETSWWLTSDGRWDNYKDQDYRDAVAEYTEEKTFKVEAGKRYYTRNGKITEPVEYKESIDWGKDYPIYAKVKDDVGFYFTIEGRRLNSHETPEDLVKEYEEKKKLTLPLEVGKKYVTVEGEVLTIENHKSLGHIVQGVDNLGQFRMYYFRETGEPNIGECKYSLVSDYIEDSSELPKSKASKKEKKKPIKYSDLTFYEAWSLAKETKKRYRLKGSEWLEFPNVKVNKETFAKTEWEVEGE
jgi:hypothetical protein